MKFTFRCNSRCIIGCTLNCIIKRTTNVFIIFLFAPLSSLLRAFSSAFHIPFHSFAPLSPLLRAFSSAFHIPSHLQSQLHLLGELFVNLLCSSKQIVDCTLKNVCTNACIIYSAGTAYIACVKQRSTTFWNYTSFLCFKIEPWSFWP